MDIYTLYKIILQKERVKTWIHESVDNKTSVKKYLQSIKVNQPNFNDIVKADLWQQINKTLYKRSRAKIIRMFYMSAAASLVLFVLTYGVYSLQEVKITTTNNQLTNYILPDNSVVDLNVNSELTYNKIAWYFNRNLTLKGEAFFSVKRGEKFNVHTADAIVSVLGTKFNVYARSIKTEVNCYSGRVSVKVHNNSNENILTKGMNIVYNNGVLTEFSGEIDVKPKWVSGDFSFINQSFYNVLCEFERQFGVYVTNKDEFKTTMFTGYFNASDLDSALELILEPLNYKSKRENKSITILKE